MFDRLRRAIAALGICSLTACSTDPATVSLTGSWTDDVRSIPGSSFGVALQESGGTVSGQGCYTIEAGRPGRVAVTGTRSGAAATLSVSFTPTGDQNPYRTETWNIQLISPDRVTGSAAGSGGPVTIALRRTSTPPSGC